ncbi:PREDICTED: multimerin-2 [Myotis davidii]|uniref:multimerin-2 n=1 Tax=Myotis davidii TaxID=225400 RepID=UPI00076783F0|nr:PREDICTED: multimerin-2 [Myotis davidii]
MILTLVLSLGGALGWGLLGASAQAPGPRFSDPHSPGLPGVWMSEPEGIGSEGSNWCPYQKSRLVTFVAACKTEKFLIHSQQPCLRGASDCQRVKVMYRIAHKPVYQVKQKVLASVVWRCCPGFAGSDCQHHDPAATPEPADLGDDLQEHWAGPADVEPVSVPYGLPGQLALSMSFSRALQPPAAETSNIRVRQERLLRGLQNDIHHPADSLPGPGTAPASNLTANLTAAVTEAHEEALEFPGKSLEQVLPFSPLWSGFNQSLHSLLEAVRNLSLDVEANRQAIGMVRDSAVPRADFQELGAKFETKVQENSQRVGQLQQDVEDRLHAQQLSLQHSLSEVQAAVDTKLKRLLKAQEHLSNSSLAAAAARAGARPEPESLQARLSQLQRNVSALHLDTSHREEALQGTLADMQATLDRHVEEIKELYSESDETFDQISAVEQQVEKLQGTQQELRELRVALMEKSLIVEENKVDTDRQLLELNLTLQHLQGGLADLIKYVTDCNCQKPPGGPDGTQEGPGNTMRAPEGAHGSLDLRRPGDGSSLLALEQRKGRKEQKALDASRRRDKKQVGPLADADVQGPAPRALGAEPPEAGSPVAFYAGFSGGTAAPQTVKFDAAHVNVGSSYFAEDGYFRAPERGVYLFAVSIEFGPGPGAGQLVFGGHHRTPIGAAEEQRGGGAATAFAMAELQKGERVWVEVTQGSVRQTSPPGTAFGGFLLFRT